MLPGGSKTRSALQSGYFDPVKLRRQLRVAKSKKNIGKAFLPSNYPKKATGLGNHYGTFAGAINHFSAQNKPKPENKKQGRNFVTNPSKKGTGYGYIGVTLGKYQDHAVEPHNRPRELRKKGPRAAQSSNQGRAVQT